jgi:hypothetical protein
MSDRKSLNRAASSCSSAPVSFALVTRFDPSYVLQHSAAIVKPWAVMTSTTLPYLSSSADAHAIIWSSTSGIARRASQMVWSFVHEGRAVTTTAMRTIAS